MSMEYTVMIADDAFFIRNLLRSILEMEGYNVVSEAADGAEAIEMYREHRPSIAIIDIFMPEKNGIETIREIIALNGEAMVLLCGGDGEEESALAARRAGAQGVIPKPFTPEQVLDVVGKITGKETSPWCDGCSQR